MSVSISHAKPTGILLEPYTPSSSSSRASSSSSASTPRPLSLAPPAPRSRAPSPNNGSSPSSARKIRFAPLPDPRRAVLVGENGEEVPLPNAEEATQITLSPALAALDTTVLDDSSLSSFGSSKPNSDTETSTTPGTTTPASTPSEYGNSRPGSPSASPISLPPLLPTSNQSVQRPKSKGLSFLKSFKRSGSSSSSSASTLTPTPSLDRTTSRERKGISTEEILTLGTINLFRTSSRESTKSTESGWSLTRWTSTNSGSRPPVKEWGAPLSRSQSSQSHHSKTPSLLSGLRRPSSSGGRPKNQGSMPLRKGTRMLNGRVYGGRGLNPNANLFANAPDVEPGFVEWGHGGMGSVQGVKSAGANSKWQRLGASQDEDLDDGGGMAWVKKRKEMREQKAREEKEAKERAEREAANGAIPETAEGQSEELSSEGAHGETASSPFSESSVATPRASTPNGSVTPNPLARVSSASINTHHSASTAVPTTPIITPATPAADMPTPSATEDHIFTTMAVPMHRGHRHTRSRDETLPPASPEESKASYFDVQVVDKNSGSGSETEESSDEEEDDDDEDDDELEEAERRKAMVIGAGMEKISRHRPEHEEHQS